MKPRLTPTEAVAFRQVEAELLAGKPLVWSARIARWYADGRGGLRNDIVARLLAAGWLVQAADGTCTMSAGARTALAPPPPAPSAPTVPATETDPSLVAALLRLQAAGGGVTLSRLSHTDTRVLARAGQRGLAEWEPYGQRWRITPAGLASIEQRSAA